MVQELQPFNCGRLDAGMAWISKEFGRNLTQYDVVKIHALGDVLHVLQHHRPIVGGTFRKLLHGPVALDALNRSKAWADDEAAPLRLASTFHNTHHFERKPGATRESMFTQAEREALIAAAEIVFAMTWTESQKFFHGEIIRGQESSLGRAWKATPIEKAPISWNLIVDAYAEITGKAAEADILKDLICF